MYKFSQRSLDNLATCHPDLQKIAEKLITIWDCAVICGHRTKEDQEKSFHDGNSKLEWPDSPHNSFPSMAMDIVPYPIDWKDTDRFFFQAGLVKGIAESMGIKIRWGNDWHDDNIFTNDTFHDYPHFELK